MVFMQIPQYTMHNVFVSEPCNKFHSENGDDEKEWNDLVQKEAAAVWLGNQTLSYARKHPEDPRVPEALHLVVRATRYACGYADDGNISKSAFMLLHKKYPNSEWTKKTPYWF